MAARFEGKVDFYHVDVDKAPDLQGKFGVRSVPTMVLVKGGKEAARMSGAQPEAQVVRFAEQAV